MTRTRGHDTNALSFDEIRKHLSESVVGCDCSDAPTGAAQVDENQPRASHEKSMSARSLMYPGWPSYALSPWAYVLSPWAKMYKD